MLVFTNKEGSVSGDELKRVNVVLSDGSLIWRGKDEDV